MFASLGSFALLLAGGAIYLWRESTREAREASRRVSFVNHVSHELKTPLTNIRLYAELLEQSLGADAEGGHAEKVAVIVDESRRLSRLIHNVLTFARRDRGSLAVTLHPGVVDDVVRSVIEDFRPRLDQKGIAVELFLSAGKRVLMDPDALEQILGNLVGNAEKYASAGGYLGLDTGHVAARTRITVRDRGPGVPVPQRERVFEPFYRSSDRLTDGVAGTGIGLTIARDLARLHGGDLRVEQPEQGSGALFVLELETPVAPGPPEDRDGPAAPGAGGLPEGGKGKA
jgi:signal transduction histidine kinase